jgi:hypothetical protein
MASMNVAVLGASGKLGPSIVHSLSAAKCFSLVVISRSSTANTTFLTPVTHVQSDYSVPSLTSIFQLHRTEVVICCLGGAASGLQISAIIPAAVAAGVKRFIPSEFGTDTLSPAVQTRMPSTKVKAEVVDCLRKASEGAANPFSWTALAVGALFDLVMATGFLGIDLSTRTATLYDGGCVSFPCTTMSIVGEALVQLLKRPEQTKNRFIYVKEFSTTGQDIVKALESIEGKQWTVFHKSTKDALDEAEFKLREKDMPGWVSLLQRTVYYDSNLDACQAWSKEEDASVLLEKAETKTMEARAEELVHGRP